MKSALHPLSAALTLGTLWAVCLFLWTFIAMSKGYGMSTLDLFAELYPYYEVSTAGAFWGLLWAFIDGFIGAYVFVWLYNFFVQKFAKK